MMGKPKSKSKGGDPLVRAFKTFGTEFKHAESRTKKYTKLRGGMK